MKHERRGRDKTGVSGAAKERRELREKGVKNPERRLVVGGLLATATVVGGGLIINKYIGGGGDPESTAEVDNSALVREIEGLMEIDKGMSRIEVARVLFDKYRLTNPSWMKNGQLNSKYITRNGNAHTVYLSTNGEQAYRVPKLPDYLPYPAVDDHRIIQVNSGNTVHVYGNSKTVDKITENAEIVREFSNLYFANLNLSSVELHLNFSSGYKPVLYRGIFQAENNNPRAKDSKGRTTTHSVLDGKSGAYSYRTDVLGIVVNLGQIHRIANFEDDSPEGYLVSTLANEMENALETQHLIRRVDSIVANDIGQFSQVSVKAEFESQIFPRNESTSTFVGLLARFNDTWADTFLGNDHEEFVSLITGEMKRLAGN